MVMGVYTHGDLTVRSLIPETTQMVDTSTVYRLKVLPRGRPNLWRQGITKVTMAVSHCSVNKTAAKIPVHECTEYRWSEQDLMVMGLPIPLCMYVANSPSADTRYANVCNIMYGSVTFDLSCFTMKIAAKSQHRDDWYGFKENLKHSLLVKTKTRQYFVLRKNKYSLNA